MRHITEISLISVLVALVSSCSLDLTPESGWSDNSYFANENQLSSCLNGGYSMMQTALGGAFVLYGAARGDEFYCSNTSRVEIDNIVNNGITQYNSYASWASFYKIIQQANLCLYHAPDMVSKGLIGKDAAAEIEGQAYCMRAFAYFWIVRIWGDAPLKLSPSINDSYDGDLARAAESEVRAQIHSDLDNAQALLSDTGDRIHFTLTSAWAIEAQLCAWEHDWDGVIEANTHILENSGYSLAELYTDDYTPTTVTDSDFYRYIDRCGMVKVFNEGNSLESIFELSYSISDNSTNNSLYGLVFKSESLRPTAAMKSMFNLSKSRDWRFFVNFYANNPRWTKYFINFDGLNEATRNIVLLRLADFVLLQAEACANKIQTAATTEDKQNMLKECISYVNIIRNRAGGPANELDSSSFDYRDVEAVKAAVLQERLYEFYGEGSRYFDLIRAGKLLEVMEPINGQNDINSAVWPVYYTELLYGKNIKQNTYYE